MRLCVILPASRLISPTGRVRGRHRGGRGHELPAEVREDLAERVAPTTSKQRHRYRALVALRGYQGPENVIVTERVKGERMARPGIDYKAGRALAEGLVGEEVDVQRA